MRTRFYIELESDGDPATLKGELAKLLQAANLAPNFDNAEIDRRRDELLKEVPDARREPLRKAFVTTLYEPMYASWGFISNVSGKIYEVRMSNAHSFRLQASVARVVSALRTRAGKFKLGLKFKPEVEIFETNEDHALEQATIVEQRLWRFARTDKRVSWRMFLLTALIAIGCLVLTMPGPAAAVLRDGLGISPAWLQWWTDTLGRLATAALVVAATALLDVYLYWRHLKGVAPVIWPLEGQR